VLVLLLGLSVEDPVIRRATAPGPSALTEGGSHFTRLATASSIQVIRRPPIRLAAADAKPTFLISPNCPTIAVWLM
jgi:hypothetical protein